MKTLLYDIFTTNLSIEEKAEFLATVYGEEREDFSMSDTVGGPYGESRITRDKEGVTVSFAAAGWYKENTGKITGPSHDRGGRLSVGRGI